MVYLISGIVFGLSAGLAPGPLLALVLSESLRSGYKAGIRVALAPLITDIPIVVCTFILVSRMAGSSIALGFISLLGALFTGYLSYETFTSRDMQIDPAEKAAKSLRKGIIANFLNPHPYLFWITVGSSMVMKAFNQGTMNAVAFVAGFYFFLVGSKVAVSIFAVKARHLLVGKGYRHCMQILGILLLLFAFLLARDALQFLKVFS